jgi:subfamily B ATP-binding cassette protein MsbA
VSLGRFLFRFVRPYLGWALVAAVAILTYAVTSTALVALIKPIFGEVLLADRSALEGSPVGGLGLVGKVENAGESGGATGEQPGAEPQPEPETETWLDHLKRRFDVADQLDRSYQSLKRRLDIDEDEVVFFVPLIFVAFFLLRSLANFLSGYSFQHIGLGTTTDIRNALYRNVLDQSSRFHAEHPSGELMARVINDVSLMQTAVSNRLLDLVQQSITLVFLLALLLSTDLKLALLCLIAAPALLYPIVRFGKGMRRISHRSQERMADLAQLLAEGVRGHRVVKAFVMEDFEDRRFREATGRHLRVNLRAQTLATLSSPVVESVAVIGGAALLIYAGLQIRQGALTAPELIRFLTNLMMMYDPVRKLNKTNLILQEALAAVQRVARLLAIPNEIEDRPGAREIDSVQRSIRFEKVTFSYEHRPVLRGIDLEIRRGEIIALVGPSGAGKTTLVNLLPRFFDPDEGRVAIDGTDLRDLQLKSLRQLIGIVTQETVLFNDTVRNNIAYGRTEIPLEHVREAAAAAYADEFVMEFSKGYDTVIGEGGMRMSGGQRQRLAIARALFKNPPILILDEATSQLDSESEALVQKALGNLMQGRTTLVIAHRLATVTRADRIVVMEEGRIVEEGNHGELLKRDGIYKRLYDLQFKG